MTATVAMLRIRFREVADVVSFPDDYLQPILDAAGRQMSADFAASVRGDDAQMLLAMHFVESLGTGRAAGVASVTAGQASVQYWSVSVVDPDTLLTTAYGRQYKRIVMLAGPAMRLLD